MDYNFELNDNVTIQSLKILVNQCWKTLPIYEGKDQNDNIIYNREEAYLNYQKHLTFLVTKISGASKIWIENQYYLELLYIISGMRDIDDNEHKRVKYLVHHCTKLLNDMIREVSKGA